MLLLRFEPSGWSSNPDIGFAKSIMDYIFRWLATKFLSTSEQERVGVIQREGGGGAVEEAPQAGLRAVPREPRAGSTDEERTDHERRLARFIDEARITGQLDHPGIVPVYELGLHEDLVVVGMRRDEQSICGHERWPERNRVVAARAEREACRDEPRQTQVMPHCRVPRCVP